MNKAGIVVPSLEKGDDGRWYLSGELNFNSVPVLARANQRIFNSESGGKELDVDLDKVSRTDSAGVALLIEWQREARRKNRIISFYNIPSQMLAIARLCGVDDFLALK